MHNERTSILSSYSPLPRFTKFIALTSGKNSTLTEIAVHIHCESIKGSDEKKYADVAFKSKPKKSGVMTSSNRVKSAVNTVDKITTQKNFQRETLWLNLFPKKPKNSAKPV